MIETVENLNFFLAMGGVVLLVSALLLLYDLLFKHELVAPVRVCGIFIAFCTTTGASLMSLVYSEIFGFTPCGLCWIQRIFLYPQVIILATALYYKDKTAARYGIALSIPGAAVALYQHYLQMGGTEFITCPTAGPTADCAERILFEFGFMTFPLISAILFIFLIVLYSYVLRANHH